MLDSKAISEYKDELKRKEDEATYFLEIGDADKAAKAQRDYDRIEEHLRKSKNHRHQTRSFSDDREKARNSVRKAINRAFAAIEQAGASKIATYLGNQISTGSELLYRDASIT